MKQLFYHLPRCNRRMPESLSLSLITIISVPLLTHLSQCSVLLSLNQFKLHYDEIICSWQTSLLTSVQIKRVSNSFPALSNLFCTKTEDVLLNWKLNYTSNSVKQHFHRNKKVKCDFKCLYWASNVSAAVTVGYCIYIVYMET